LVALGADVAYVWDCGYRSQSPRVSLGARGGQKPARGAEDAKTAGGLLQQDRENRTNGVSDRLCLPLYTFGNNVSRAPRFDSGKLLGVRSAAVAALLHRAPAARHASALLTHNAALDEHHD
jgi:hypothetical protein